MIPLHEYGYNSDGVRVWKRDGLNGQEYRYVCRTGCGDVPMRVYNRAMNGGDWNTLEEYLDAPTVRWYGAGANSYSDYSLLAGHWLSRLTPLPAGRIVCQDRFGVYVSKNEAHTPEYLASNSDIPDLWLPNEGVEIVPMMAWVIPVACALVCGGAAACLWHCHSSCGGWNLSCIFDCFKSNPLCAGVGLGCLACIIYYGWRLLVRWYPNIRTYIIQCGEEYDNISQFIFCVIRLCTKTPPLPKSNIMLSVLTY